MKSSLFNNTFVFVLLFTFTLPISLKTNAQVEICQNQVDDDGDGLFDCADPDCIDANCELAIPCSNTLYQVISGVLNKFNPITSSYEVVGDSQMGSYNGAGYNVQDGYIYAIKGIGGSNHMIRIDGTGKATDIGAINNWTGITYSADMDTDGNWIAFVGGNSPAVRKVDVDVFPLTMVTTPITNLSGTNIPNTADITFNPVTEKYYGMTSSFKMVEIDPINLTANIIADFDGSGGGFGAAWSDFEGNSYFSQNTTGEIYRSEFDNAGNPVNLEIVAYGQITNNNDGINCVLSAPPFESKCDDGIDNDGDGLTDSEDPDCAYIPEFTTFTNGPSLKTDNTWGITWVDYNNDCYDDIFVPTYTENEPSRLFKNNTDGTFTEITDNALVQDLGSSTAASWGDFNNDGQIDLVVSNNVGEEDFLYLNSNFGQTFTRAEESAFLSEDGYGHGASFVDYDNDGLLDIFICDYFPSKFNRLYRNLGDGNFEKITSGEIVNEGLTSIGATWSDVNNDGFQDVFVPNHLGSNYIYINNGDRTFTKQSLGDNATSVGGSFGDMDNDGDMDLFVANASKEANLLYSNDGNGNFTQVTTGYIAEDAGDSHGSAWGDFNNDGWLDLFVTNDREGSKFFYLNQGDGTFIKALNTYIIAPTGNSFGVATSDFDNDGDLDLTIANHSDEANFLYVNQGNANNYINLILKGTNSNASAIGARITLTATINGQSVTQIRDVQGQSGGGPGSQNSLAQHFGLGDALEIESIVIDWPSGYTQYLTNVPANEKRIVTEEDGSLVSGTIYNDANSNCQQDDGEVGMANIIVEAYNIEADTGPIVTMTNEDGFYQFNLPAGDYTIGQQLPENYSNICPGPASTHQLTVGAIGNTYPNNDFANLAETQSPDLEVSIGATALRRGFDTDLVINYSNKGVATATNVLLSVTLDSEITPVDSDVAWISQDGLTLTWDLGTLEVNENGSINLLNYVELSAVIGSQKNFSANIVASETDLNPLDNEANTLEEIVGAIDPNDILVSPMGFGPAGQISVDQELTYRIRFQNVGNYYAQFATIIDTLPSTLDLSTFKQGAASHPYKLELSDNGILTWKFDDIYLPDSITNEPESHGFVQFSIRPKKQLPDNTTILNRASIQFDYNPYVITNTVRNTIKADYESLNTEEQQLFVYPNPASEFTNIYLYHPMENNKGGILTNEGYRSGEKEVWIYAADGKLTDSFKMKETQKQISLEGYIDGMYIIECLDDQGNRFVGKLMVVK